MQNDTWQQGFHRHFPMYQPFTSIIAAFDQGRFPCAKEWSALAQQYQLYNQQHQPIQFIAQHTLNSTDYYEQSIDKHGIISHREQNWHDYFNALVWFAFPRLKALISRQHCAELNKTAQQQQRTILRDALTHLDESGMIVISDNTALLNALKQHDWHSAFIQQRAAWQTTHICTIGHGLLQKALKPYIGFTAKCLYFSTQDILNHDSHLNLVQQLDLYLSKWLQTAPLNKTDLYPLPLLGIPGWCADNETEVFYHNRQYFRPKNKKASG